MSDPDAQTAIQEKKEALEAAIADYIEAGELDDVPRIEHDSQAQAAIRDLIAAVEASKVSEVERLKRYERGMRNHLCEHDMADWLACSFNHIAECVVCQHDNGTEHTWLQRAEAAESSLASKDAEIAQTTARLLNATTTGIDTERRRWYAALETRFALPRNTLEGFAPEVAVERLDAEAALAELQKTHSAAAVPPIPDGAESETASDVYTVEQEPLPQDFSGWVWIVTSRDSGIVQARTWHSQLAHEIANALNTRSSIGQRGSMNSQSKLTEETVRTIRERLRDGATGASLSREYGVSENVIYQIKHNKIWRHVSLAAPSPSTEVSSTPPASPALSNSLPTNDVAALAQMTGWDVDATEEYLDDVTRAILRDLSDGDGQHTEALDHNLIKKHLRLLLANLPTPAAQRQEPT